MHSPPPASVKMADHPDLASSRTAFVVQPPWQWPRAGKWHRVQRMLLFLAVAQCFTSIYIYIVINRHIFFAAWLAYAISAALLMLMRAMYGLLWVALGSAVYCVWLAVLTIDSMEHRQWIPMCFDFSLASFEFLIFCLAISRFHELGGLTPCCGPPSTRWRHELLVGEGIERARVATWTDEEEGLEGGTQNSVERYMPPQYSFKEPLDGIPVVSSSVEPDVDDSPTSTGAFHGCGSHPSSITSSYAHKVGRGELLATQEANFAR